MYSTKARGKLFGILLTASLLSGIALFSATGVQAQNVWRQNQQDRDWDRDRDRDGDRHDRRDRDRDNDRDRQRGNGRWGRGRLGRYGQRGNAGYGNYGSIYQVAQQRGYQDGLNTGANDARRGQSYNPQRSHYYQNATYGYDSSYGNKNEYKQAYRQGFLQGYRQGFQQYGGYNRNGTYNQRWPW